MTPAEIKAAASARIVLLDDYLQGQEIVLNLAHDNVPTDQRAERLLQQADVVLSQTTRANSIRRAARLRELLARYVAS